MSTYNAIGEVGLNELLARRLTTPGGSSAPGVAPEIFPTRCLENDRPEWGYLKNEGRGSLARNIAAVSGEYGQLWISNPWSPNLMIIERIEVINTGTIQLGMGALPGFSVGSLTGNGAPRDSRYPIADGLVYQSGTAAIQPTLDRLFARLTSALIFSEPIILRPTNAYGLILFHTATNTPLTVNVHYRLRGAQPGELR